MKDNIQETRGCKICNGHYVNKGQCPGIGLKWKGSICVRGEVRILYKPTKVRNNVPWYIFWKKHYTIENIVQQVLPVY